MDSTGAQCWCNFLVSLELASNSRDLIFFFLPFLTGIVIASHHRLFLHNIAGKNASVAQDTHDPQVVLWKSIMNFFLSRSLVTCCWKQTTRWTEPLILLNGLLFDWFVQENEEPEHTETNCTVLRASGSPRTEVPGPKPWNLWYKVLWIMCTQSSDHKAHHKPLSRNGYSP